MMRHILLAAALCLTLGACAGPMQAAVLNDIQHCDRDYTLAAGSGGAGLAGPSFNLSGHITCKALPAAPSSP